MQYKQQYQNFNSLLNQYLKVNDGFTIKGEVQTLSAQLTNISKQAYFLEIGIECIFNQPMEKNKLVFITSLIKDKFKFDFQVMDIQQLLHYYNKLCETAYFLGCKYYSVYSNLALAFAYIFIHISARSDQQLEHFLKPFAPSDPNHYHHFNYYFKILECLVVEIDNPRLVIDEEYREIAKAKLLAQQYSILIKLNEITTAAWEIQSIDKENIIQCFIEWVTATYNPEVLNSIPNHYAINKLFQYVQDENQTNVTAESLKRLITHLGTPTEIPLLYDYLGVQMVELLSVVDQYSKNADLSEAEDYLKIIVEFCGKSILSFIVNFDDRIYQFLKRLAKYTKDELVDAYKDLVELWEQFISQAIEQRKRTALNPQISVLIEEVYDSICEQCHYSLKLIHQLNTRPQSRLYEFNRSGQDIFNRRQNSDTIFQKICQFYGKVEYLQIVYNKIEVISTKAEQFLWPYLEVYLFSLTESIEDMQGNCKQVSNIISIYIELTRKENFTIPTILKKTFLTIFKGLMTIKAKDVNFIKLLFNLTSTCFESTMLMPYAGETFEVGCKHNHAIMKDNFQEMAVLIQKYPNNQSIVKGVIYLMYAYEELTHKYLPSILSYLFQLLQSATSPQSRLYHKELMYSLISIIKVLQEVAPQNTAYISIITQFTGLAFPYILQTLKNPKRLNNDEDPQVERMVRLVKMIMRYIKLNFTQFLQPLYSTVLESFALYPICSYAYLFEIAITVFYENEQYTQYLKAVYIKFCQTLFLHMNQISKMDQYCYLLDDFIGISRRFFVYNASIVLNSGQLPNIIDLCTNAFIGSNTPRIAKAAYNFFQTIFMVYWRQEFIDEYNSKVSESKFSTKKQNEALYFQLKTLLIQKLEFIIRRIMQHLSQTPQETTREQILFTLLSELKAFPQQNTHIWPKILASIPSDILVANQKMRFMANLELMKGSDFAVVGQAARLIKRYLILMNKRMVNANNRKFKF